MRKTLNAFTCFSNNPSPRHSPVINKQSRNPFDDIISTGFIKPVCHKSKLPLAQRKSPRLPSLSPVSPLKLPKIFSEGHLKIIKKQQNILIQSLKFGKKSQERNTKTPFFNEKEKALKEITFGE